MITVELIQSILNCSSVYAQKMIDACKSQEELKELMTAKYTELNTRKAVTIYE